MRGFINCHLLGRNYNKSCSLCVWVNSSLVLLQMDKWSGESSWGAGQSDWLVLKRKRRCRGDQVRQRKPTRTKDICMAIEIRWTRNLHTERISEFSHWETSMGSSHWDERRVFTWWDAISGSSHFEVSSGLHVRWAWILGTAWPASIWGPVGTSLFILLPWLRKTYGPHRQHQVWLLRIYFPWNKIANVRSLQTYISPGVHQQPKGKL